MPLNTVRLNFNLHEHPNSRIVFIKPLPRPPSRKAEYERAETVLKAIAAQCLPIMKQHYLSVTTLEEHEPNPEFIGRNFNNGECIQLVIRSRSGAWLPLNMIQMVMMHELAHNLHMNHGKSFWTTRNTYASEMQALFRKGYTGDGLWSRGRVLGSAEQALGDNIAPSQELVDLNLCGGTFRSRKKKRKAKGSALTWKEKRAKRIEQKFGKHGQTLGRDDDKQLALDINTKGPLGTKPRVAQSKRGRELRAAAALARFATNKQEVEQLETATATPEDESSEDTASESEYEEIDARQEIAKDANGRRIVDSIGNPLIRVCEKEDTDDVEVKNEMKEISNLANASTTLPEDSADLEGGTYDSGQLNHKAQSSASTNTSLQVTAESTPSKAGHVVASTGPDRNTSSIDGGQENQVSCPICSMINDAMQSTCVACAHVLDVRKDPRHWRCQSATCQDSAFINGGDCGVCNICGSKRPTSTETADNVQTSRPQQMIESCSSHIADI